MWTCPKCETVNSGSKCTDCGEIKKEARKSVKQNKTVIITVIVAAVIAVGVILFLVLRPGQNTGAPAPEATTQQEIGDQTNAEAPAQAEAPVEELKIIPESEMSAETQAEVKAITDACLAGLNDKSAAKIMEYIDADFGATQGQLTGFFNTATGGGKAPYVLQATYYVNNVENPQDTLNVKKNEADTTYAKFSAGGAEACIALLTSENQKVSQVITLVIIRKEEKMKIAYIDTSDSGYYGKKAPEYFTMAKQAKESGKHALAYVYGQMMNNICQPGNALYYDETDAMIKYIGELAQWSQESYPKQVIDDKHTIHLIGLSLEDVGVVPMIFYQTEVNIESADIQADAQKVKDAFLKDNPDIAEAFPKITVHASNVTPAEATSPSTYKKIVFNTK